MPQIRLRLCVTLALRRGFAVLLAQLVERFAIVFRSDLAGETRGNLRRGPPGEVLRLVVVARHLERDLSKEAHALSRRRILQDLEGFG